MTTTLKGRKAIEKKNTVLQRLTVEYVAVSSISPNFYNPNKQSDHDFELLLHSMEEDGFTQPIVCQQDRTIVDGEHRWTAAIVLHYLHQNHLPLTKEHILAARYRRTEIMDPELTIPVVFVDMSAEQMRIATLRHNRARGNEDFDLTAQLFADLRELGALDWAADSLMLSDVDIDRLLKDIPAPESLAATDYGAAWEPDKIHQEEITHNSTEVRIAIPNSTAPVYSALSASAVDAMRDRERRVTEAKTQEERTMILADTRFYRINLVFAGDEASLVQHALGKHPAETILTWCELHKDDAP